MLKEGISKCPCPKIKCKRHSNCEQCIERHSKKKNKAYCERDPVQKDK